MNGCRTQSRRRTVRSSKGLLRRSSSNSRTAAWVLNSADLDQASALAQALKAALALAQDLDSPPDLPALPAPGQDNRMTTAKR